MTFGHQESSFATFEQQQPYLEQPQVEIASNTASDVGANEADTSSVVYEDVSLDDWEPNDDEILDPTYRCNA